MRNQLRSVAAFGKGGRPALVCSLIAVVICVCCNIWVSRAEYVDPGFVPCDKGPWPNAPAICNSTATCTTSSWLWGVRVAIINGYAFATAACPSTTVFNRASIKLLIDHTGIKDMSESQLYSGSHDVIFHLDLHLCRNKNSKSVLLPRLSRRLFG